MSDFARCLELIFRHEGGAVNDPRDPGGKTKYGISQRAYPNEDIANLTKERATELYRRDYWRLIHGDELPFPLAVSVLDAAVNSGVRRSIQWLQNALHIPCDGKIGPQTISAATSCNLAGTAQRYADIRLDFLQRDPRWPTFGKGWTRRVQDTLHEALQWTSY